MTNDKDCRMAIQQWRDSLSPEHCRHFTAWQIAEQAFQAGAAWQQSRQGVVTDEDYLDYVREKIRHAASDCQVDLQPDQVRYILKAVISALGCLPSQVKLQISEEELIPVIKAAWKSTYKDCVSCNTSQCTFDAGVIAKAVVEAIRKAGV